MEGATLARAYSGQPTSASTRACSLPQRQALQDGMCVVIGMQSTGGGYAAGHGSSQPGAPTMFPMFTLYGESNSLSNCSMTSTVVPMINAELFVRPKASTEANGMHIGQWHVKSLTYACCHCWSRAEANMSAARDLEGDEGHDDLVSAPKMVLHGFITKHLFKGFGELSNASLDRLLAQ
eukprot:scaffold3313_cov21-Tisochrysis_lutea.AAC.1